MSRLSRSSDDLEASQPLHHTAPNHTQSMDDPRIKRTNLYLAAICANFSFLSAGCAMGWTSPALPRLMEAKTITQDEASWLTALLAVGGAIGPFIAYKFVDKIGRKWTIIFDMILFVISWALIGFASAISSSVSPIEIKIFQYEMSSNLVSYINIMYVARFLGGLAVGCIFMVTPMYVSEIADTLVRSALGSLMQLFIVLGFLIEYCVGPYFSLNILAVASVLPPVICLFMFLLILPETPLYLMSQYDTQAAGNSLQWLRQHRHITQEIAEIQTSLQESRSTEACSWSSMLRSRDHVKVLLYGFALVSFQQFSGINVVLFYTESIFKMAASGAAELTPAMSSIVVGVVFMLSSMWAPPLTKKFGLKFLLWTSSLSGAVFQGILGLYYFCKEELKSDVSQFSWVPVTCVIVYITTYSVGLGPLPWAFINEILPLSIKSKGSALSSSLCWIWTFFLSKYFVIISADLGAYICFWLFSAFCLVSFLFIKFKLPDTRGLTLVQIHNLFYS